MKNDKKSDNVFRAEVKKILILFDFGPENIIHKYYNQYLEISNLFFECQIKNLHQFHCF